MTNPETSSDMTVSNEKLAEMLAAATGVTPGPWHRHEAPGITSVRSPGFVICSVSYGRHGAASSHRDANHIANCDPQTITDILTELTTLRSQLSGMTEETSSAVAAERERCARVAERDGSSHDATFSQQTAEWHARVNAEVRAADRIASAIRSEPNHDQP